MNKLRVLSLLTVGLLLLALPSEAQRGFGQYELPEEDPSAFKIITPPYLDEAVRKIARLRADLDTIKNEKERKALLTRILGVCQDELDRDVNGSGLVAMRDGTVRGDGKIEVRRWLGAYNAVEAEIRKLGSEGLALYEELYGKRAENLLAAGAASRDLDRVLDVNKRFGLTQAGLKAAQLLAQIHWESGKLSPAARALERALEFRELLKPEIEASVSAWLSRCYRELGERANLAQLRLYSKPLKNIEVDLGGTRRALEEILAEDFAKTRDSTNETIESLGVSWPGGNYANTGIADAPTPPDSVAWHSTLPRLEASLWQNRYMGYNFPVCPPYLPASDGSMIYVNNGDALCAYDVLTGGQHSRVMTEGKLPVWRCKPFAPSPEQRGLWWRTCEPDPALTLPVSVYKGTVFAPLENPMREPIHERMANNRFGLYSHYPQVRRALCAVDGETGRLLWKLGGLYEGSDLDQTSFGPAIVHEGTLYAIAARVPSLPDIMLFALDPTNGRVLWRIRLCYGQQEVTMFGRPARWPFTSLPAIAGGELFLCTNLGGIVAVNLERRSLSWVAKYDYMCRPVTNYIFTYYRPVTWYNSPTIYAEVGGDGYVICAPADCQDLVCINARTGERAWSLPRAVRDGQSYDESDATLRGARALIGVRGGLALVGGATTLYAVNVASGKLSKLVNVVAEPSGGRSTRNELQGWPAMAGNKLLWPGSAGITEIDLDTWRCGRTYSAPTLGRVPGLSVFVQQGITFTVAGNDYSQGNAQIAARFDANILLTDARLRVANSPNDADAALRYGLLNLRMGDKVEAAKWLQKAFTLASAAPINSRVLHLAGRVLISTLLEAADAMIAKERYMEALGQIEAARQYATLPAQLSECFTRNELCLIKRSETAELKKLYAEIIERDPPFGVGSDPEIPARYYALVKLARLHAAAPGSEREALALYEMLFAAPENLSVLRVSLRQIAINEVSALLDSRGRAFYAERENAARELANSRDLGDLRKALRQYPHALASDGAALKLAALLLNENTPQSAAALLQGALDEVPRRARRGEILALLAISQSRTGEALRARLTALRALREYPEGELEFEGKRAKFKDLLAELVKGAPPTEESTPPPRIANPLTELWSHSWAQGTFMALPPQPPPGQTPLILMSKFAGNDPLQALNPQDGKLLWSGGEDYGPLNDCARLKEGLLLQFSRGLSMVSDQGENRWNWRLGNATPDNVDARDGMVVFSTSISGSGARRMRIHALDASSGKQAWENILEANSVLWIRQCAQGVLVLMIGREDSVALLDIESGSEIRRLKLDRPAARGARAKPFIADERLWLCDEAGNVSIYDLDGFVLKSRISSAQGRPTLFAPHKGNALVLGYPGAAVCDPAAGKVLWRTPFKAGENIVEHAMTGDVLIVALIEGFENNRIVGVSLADGALAFDEKVEPEDEHQHLKLRAGVTLQDGAAFGYALTDTSTGMVELMGFKLIVIDKTGRRRLEWPMSANSSAESMRLAAIDGYIVLTADRTTHCFGAKE